MSCATLFCDTSDAGQLTDGGFTRMRIGLFAGTTPDTSFGLADLVAFARDLEARGFDTTMAASQYDKSLTSWTAKDKGAPVLNQGRRHTGIPYLDGLYNTPDSGFGM